MASFSVHIDDYLIPSEKMSSQSIWQAGTEVTGKLISSVTFSHSWCHHFTIEPQLLIVM